MEGPPKVDTEVEVEEEGLEVQSGGKGKQKKKSKEFPPLGPAEIKHVLARMAEGKITIGQIIGKAAKAVVKILV